MHDCMVFGFLRANINSGFGALLIKTKSHTRQVVSGVAIITDIYVTSHHIT